jgi:uncharacterized membrane protein
VLRHLRGSEPVPPRGAWLEAPRAGGSRSFRFLRAIRVFLVRWFRRLSTTGLLLGTLFFAFSLTPSLVPRPVGFQGIVSGLSLSLGYALGVAGRWLWYFLELPGPGVRTHRILLKVAGAICLGTAAVFLWRASEWQNSVRLLMGMEAVETVRPFTVALITVSVFLLALLVGRKFNRTFRFLSRRLKRFVPRRVAYVTGVLLASALFWTVTEGLIFAAALRMADGSYRQLDALIPDDMAPPADPMRTGSGRSLIAWQDLGRQGRSFVAEGPTGDEIGAFLGEGARDPVRVYVGLNAAGSPRERARLALEELIRVGGFERSVLLLVTPTGTGWVDPAGLDPLEFLLRGDIASVAAQYSYLPSPLALIAEGAYGAETARALFEEVYGHWTRLPADDRPELYLYGLSLGALNSDLSFHLHDILADPFQGALWVGPPFRSETWASATADRQPGSAEWLPRYRNGAVVRFMSQAGGRGLSHADWGPFRILFLQQGSDPITFFSVRSAFREPGWMRPPRAPDVSPELRWYPVVTMLQLAADMAAGAEAAPPGYGHNFAAEDYIDAWVALMEPEGWSRNDVERLKSRFAWHPPGGLASGAGEAEPGRHATRTRALP